MIKIKVYEWGKEFIKIYIFYQLMMIYFPLCFGLRSVGLHLCYVSTKLPVWKNEIVKYKFLNFIFFPLRRNVTH